MDATTNTDAPAPVITLSDAALKEVKRLINVQGIEEGASAWASREAAVPD